MDEKEIENELKVVLSIIKEQEKNLEKFMNNYKKKFINPIILFTIQNEICEACSSLRGARDKYEEWYRKKILKFPFS